MALKRENLLLLLGLEVEVESVREPVELEVTGRDEPGPGGGGDSGGILVAESRGDGGPGGGRGLAVEPGEMSCKVSCQQLGLVVRRVVGVDKGRGGDGVVVVLVIVLLNLAGLVADGGLGSGLASGGNVVAAGDPEAVDACRVLDGVGPAVIANVLILANPVVVGVGLLPDDDAVLLLGRVAKLFVANVKALLLEDPGEARVAVVARVGTGEGLPGGGGDKKGATKLQTIRDIYLMLWLYDYTLDTFFSTKPQTAPSPSTTYTSPPYDRMLLMSALARAVALQSQHCQWGKAIANYVKT
jgi:hypothetical protein